MEMNCSTRSRARSMSRSMSRRARRSSRCPRAMRSSFREAPGTVCWWSSRAGSSPFTPGPVRFVAGKQPLGRRQRGGM